MRDRPAGDPAAAERDLTRALVLRRASFPKLLLGFARHLAVIPILPFSTEVI